VDRFVAEPVIGPAISGRTRWLLAMPGADAPREGVASPARSGVQSSGRPNRASMSSDLGGWTI
jgi:hypothetical protein